MPVEKQHSNHDDILLISANKAQHDHIQTSTSFPPVTHSSSAGASGGQEGLAPLVEILAPPSYDFIISKKELMSMLYTLLAL